jgi:cobalamin biosynthesis Co2+ chelatase CbiK
MSGDLKCLRLQEIFWVVLESFKEVQDGNALNNIHLHLGKKSSKVVNLKIPLFFIIGDMQGGDKMCCTSASYSNTMKRPCRKCNVHGKDLGNPNKKCKKISMDYIKKLVTEEKVNDLKMLNQRNVYSPFFSLNYGGCKYGIFFCLLPS